MLIINTKRTLPLIHIVLQGNVNLREVNVAFRGSDRMPAFWWMKVRW